MTRLLPRGLPAIAAVVVLFAACSRPVPGEVSRRQLQWQRKHVANYDFVFFRESMVGRCSLLIEVRHGKVASARRQQKCAWPLDPADAPTIDGVFASEKSEYRRHHVEASYDSTYGYPTGVGVDPIKNAIDDEWGFGVASFHAV